MWRASKDSSRPPRPSRSPRRRRRRRCRVKRSSTGANCWRRSFSRPWFCCSLLRPSGTQVKFFLSFFKKMGHYRPLFLYFRLFNTVDNKKWSIKDLPMTGFELWISGIRIDCSTNWGTTTAPLFFTSLHNILLCSTHLLLFAISYLKWAIPELFFLYFRLFYKQITVNIFNKSCRWLDSNPGPLVLKATALSADQQQLPLFAIS